jgi:tyrosine-protein kinase Etk/Wzc
MKSEEIDVIDVLLVLLKHKKFIIWTVAIVSIFAVVYSFITPEYWVATTTLLPAQEGRDAFSLANTSSLLGVGSSLFGGNLNSTSLELVTILNSRTFSEDIINKFNLINYLKINEPDSLVAKELSYKIFREEIRNFSIDDETGLITISIETKDKYLSTDIANYHVKKLEEYNIETRMSKGRQKRIFLEKRIEDVRSNLDELSQRFMNFQKENNIIELEQQTAQIVGLYVELIAQKTAKEIELEYSQQISGEDNPLLNILRKENEILEKKISEFEISSTSNHQYIIRLDKLPELAVEYANLKLNLEIQEKVFSFLFPQYEQAKIEEIKDLPTIEIIDKAVPAGLRSKPKRAKLCITAFILALLLASLLSYMYDKIINSPNIKRLKKNNMG